MCRSGQRCGAKRLAFEQEWLDRDGDSRRRQANQGDAKSNATND